MTPVLITGILALFFLQLAVGQSTACQNAIITLINNINSCASVHSSTFCSGPCRGYYQAVVDNCNGNVSWAYCVKSLVCVHA